MHATGQTTADAAAAGASAAHACGYYTDGSRLFRVLDLVRREGNGAEDVLVRVENCLTLDVMLYLERRGMRRVRRAHLAG